MKTAEKKDTYVCRRCSRRVDAHLGCDDAFPHLCDDCWCDVSMSPEAVAFRATNTRQAKEQ
jgi:hypothetical protein